jgi:uracil-DNA glycosylase family protein
MSNADGCESPMAEATTIDRPSSIKKLSELKDAIDGCTRCPLYKNATQGVPGEGPAGAPLMLIGEQPGNDEDLAGRPFVGPAGRVLDKALGEAGIDRKKVYVTNAVRHFKFEPRGKRRLHKRPNAHEIERCRWWTDLERVLVEPKLIIAMGATAARGLLGKTVVLNQLRGKIFPLPGGATQVIVTIHPSYLLRIRDSKDKAIAYAGFLADLRLGANFLKKRAA